MGSSLKSGPLSGSLLEGCRTFLGDLKRDPKLENDPYLPPEQSGSWCWQPWRGCASPVAAWEARCVNSSVSRIELGRAAGWGSASKLRVFKEGLWLRIVRIVVGRSFYSFKLQQSCAVTVAATIFGVSSLMALQSTRTPNTNTTDSRCGRELIKLLHTLRWSSSTSCHCNRGVSVIETDNSSSDSNSYGTCSPCSHGFGPIHARKAKWQSHGSRSCQSRSRRCCNTANTGY